MAVTRAIDTWRSTSVLEQGCAARWSIRVSGHSRLAKRRGYELQAHRGDRWDPRLPRVLATFFAGGDSPDIQESSTEWLSFIQDKEGSLRYDATVQSFIAVFFIVFSTGLFTLLRTAERDAGDAWATVGFVGAIFTVAMVASAYSAQSGLLLHVDSLSDEPEALKALARYFDGAFLMISIGFAVFLGGIGIAGLKTRVLTAIFALVGGVASLAVLFGNTTENAEESILGIFGFIGFIVFVIFNLATGIWMVRDRGAPSRVPGGAG